MKLKTDTLIVIGAGVILLYLLYKKALENPALPDTTVTITPEIKKLYVDRMMYVAKRTEGVYGIKPLIALAQSAHESRWGTSRLTKTANNYFGMKTGSAWEKAGKPFVSMPTTEYNGVPVTANFRKYDSALLSFLDWGALISGKNYPKSYAEAKAGDINGYAVQVKAEGYATDPQYTRKIASVGEDVAQILA